jgi:DNA replication protein DnaC
MDNRHPAIGSMLARVESFCRGMAKAPGQGAKLVLVGQSGAGKTMAARAVYSWLGAVAHGIPYIDNGAIRTPNRFWIYWPTFLDRLKAGSWWEVKAACDATLLILDDIGSDHDPSRMGVDKLCTILEVRARKWTIVTTNLLPSQWEERFDRRVASRLNRNSRVVDLSQVPDYSSKP